MGISKDQWLKAIEEEVERLIEMGWDEERAERHALRCADALFQAREERAQARAEALLSEG